MLMIPAPSWRYQANNMASTPTTVGVGTAVTAGASNTDGSNTALGSALTFEAEYLVLAFSAFFSSGNNGSCLCDILIDPAGGTSWNSTPLISDLLVGFTQTVTIGSGNAVGIGAKYHFPLRVPSGASLGARVRTAHTSTIAGRVGWWAFGGNAEPGTWWSGQIVETIGATPASSIGTSHTPGNTGTYSSWTNFGSTATRHAKAVQWAIQGVMGNTATALGNHFEFGISSQRIGPTIYRALSTGEAGFSQPDMPIFASIPSGSQLMARATCSGTAEALDIAAYLVS